MYFLAQRVVSRSEWTLFKWHQDRLVTRWIFSRIRNYCSSVGKCWFLSWTWFTSFLENGKKKIKAHVHSPYCQTHCCCGNTLAGEAANGPRAGAGTFTDGDFAAKTGGWTTGTVSDASWSDEDHARSFLLGSTNRAGVRFRFLVPWTLTSSSSSSSSDGIDFTGAALVALITTEGDIVRRLTLTSLKTTSAAVTTTGF